MGLLPVFILLLHNPHHHRLWGLCCFTAGAQLDSKSWLRCNQVLKQRRSSLISFSAFAFFSGGSLPSLPLSTFLSWSSWQSPWRRWQLERRRKWNTGSHIKDFIRSNMGKTSWMMSEPTWWLLMRRWYLDIFPLLLWYLWTMCVLLSHFYQLILSITKEGHSWPFMTHTHRCWQATDEVEECMWTHLSGSVHCTTVNNQHKHLSFILLSAGRPLCLFLHLLLSSQNPHRRQAQEVEGRSQLVKCVVTKRARRDSWWESWHAWELEGRGRWGKATTMTGELSFKTGRNKFPSSSICY